MRTIIFIGSTNSSYARGKDKKKRKSRGILTASGLSIVGGSIGSNIAQSGVFVKNRVKTYLKKHPKTSKISMLLARPSNHSRMYQHIKQIRADKPSILFPQHTRNMAKYVKLLDKAKLRGGAKGAVIGAGLGLGGTYLVNKLKNRKKK